ncbi:MAG TPA: PEGA domain-containing protein [Patescibacteria group bacterium]|nr:PEGA domain-containing protein [Patescibacteria group bacterium]
MDFLDPSKKRARSIRLFVGYILVAIAVAAASLILLLQAYGYDVNRQTGQVIQNGLVFVSAHPAGANVSLNGVNKGRTDLRLTIPAAQYTISLTQPGYRDWKRTFTLDGGGIERLSYPVLFPVKLTTKDLQLYGEAPVFATSSPDHHWLLVEQPGSLTEFDNFDLGDPTKVSTLVSLPKDVLSASTGAQTLKTVEWSTDNRHVLVQHDYSGGTEFIMIDRQDPASSFNVNKLFGLSPTNVALRNKHYDQLYLYDGSSKTLQTADVKAKLTAPILDKVIDFKAYGANTVLYATDDSATPGKNAIRVWDGKQSYLIHYYPAASGYALDMAGYNGDTYMVVAPKNGGQVYIYKNALEQAKRSSKLIPAPFIDLRLDQPGFVSFSDTAQFILAQNGDHFAAYDAQTNQRYYYELKDQIEPTQQATWMDGNRLVMVLAGKTVVFDYDGINKQTLSASQPDVLPFFNQAYSGLYNIAPSVDVPGHFALTRTELVAK